MANVVFENKVIEAKLNNLLTTALNTRSLMTIDNSLTEEAGMIKVINVYNYTGEAEELAEGQGNTKRGSITHTSNNYTVKMVQHSFDYTDEAFMKDNTIVDNMLKSGNNVMVNKMTSDFFAECAKATAKHTLAGGEITYNDIVDAISELNIEDESKLFIIIPNEWKAAMRKDEDYKTAHAGDVIYNGQVGVVAGIPVIATKALTDKAYVMTKEAVRLIMKKDLEIEQKREADERNNVVFLRAAYICALTDATQICAISA